MMSGTVKGTIVLQPFGLQIWRLIQKKINKRLQSLDFNEIVLPSLISPSLLKLEQTHLKGFEPEFFSVVCTKADILKKKIGVLRPTSELLVCAYFREILSRYSHLPLQYYQWGSVFRAEKNTKPFLRNCEFWWQEGHTLHEDHASAELFVNKIHKFYVDFIVNTCLLNYLSGAKTALEKFAGACSTYAVETILPDGQALQCATTHDLGTNFTKPFGIKFQTKQNIYKHPFQTSFGISSRIIGALVMEHSDQFGLLLPSQLCPTNVVILLKTDAVDQRLTTLIKKNIDKLQSTSKILISNNPKQEFDKLVCRGAIIVIYINLMACKQMLVPVYVRYLNTTVNVRLNNLEQFIINQIAAHDRVLQKRATQIKIQKTVSITTLKQLAIVIKNQEVARAYFILNKENEITIKQKTTATIRCVKHCSKIGNCFFSNKPCNTIVYLSKAY